jgi:general secretion pathway protein N
MNRKFFLLPLSVLAVIVMLGAGFGRAAVAQAPRNPLWAIPLSELSATRERPIFSPSRRPPSPAVAAAPYVPPQSAKPVEPERPQLFLIGTIAGDKGGLGIFLDYSTDTILRLKAGEGYKGWILREVRSREIVLEKGDKTATLPLPAPSSARPDEPGKESQ